MGKSGPSGKDKPGATGEEETPGHPARGDFEASGRGGARRHPVRGKPRTTSAKGKLWANWRRGNPELCGARKALSHLGKGKTLSLLALGETPGHLAKRKL